MGHRTRILGAVTGGLVSGGASGTVSGHVRYVAGDGPTGGNPYDFLQRVLLEPFNAALLVTAMIGFAITLAWYRRYQPGRSDLQALREALQQYVDFVPWMLRLALGIPLVGAGFNGYYFVPAVPIEARLFQVALGFFLLAGLATRAIAAIGLVAYLVGLASDPRLLLGLEFVGGFLGLCLLGGGRPSVDHMLGHLSAAGDTAYGKIDPVGTYAAQFNDWIEPYTRYAPTVVRVVLGTGFIVLGVSEKLARPEHALVVVHQYDLSALVPVDPGLWVVGAALTEIAVGLALVSGTYTRAAAALAFVVLTTTLFGLPNDPVVPHVTLFGLTTAVLTTGSGPLAVDTTDASDATGRSGVYPAK